MDIIIKKGNPKGRTRSTIEGELIKEGWGKTMTPEQGDKCKFLEREVKERYGADKSMFKQHHIDKVR